MSKMGISTYQSYCGAQIFEAVGLSSSLVDKYFTGTASNIQGIGLFEVADEAFRMHQLAFGDDPVLRDALDAGGEYQYRSRGEEHAWTPESIAKLQHAARSNNHATYRDYAKLINDQTRRMMTLRGMFEFRFAPEPVPIDEVEPASEIVKRFATGAMSLGSISTEAHTTLAVAMNRIGGKSNTGEGGEDARRYPLIAKGETLKSRIDSVVVDVPVREGDSLRSKIKQVASARFGVTAEYLVNADQLQIKMAQGAKPGEGGQLPGHKVSEYIAQLRVFGSRRRLDLAAAASRHLLDRGSRAADPRFEERESAGVDQRQAGLGSRRGHGCGGRGQGEGGSRHHRRSRRRHGSVSRVVDQARGHAVGAGPRGNAADPGAEPAARAASRFRSTAR